MPQVPLTSSLLAQIATLITSAGQQYALATDADIAGSPFTPTVPTNWPLPLPTTIQEALDDLALSPNITALSNAGILNSAGTVPTLSSIQSANRRGLFLALAQISGGLSLPGTMTLALRVNGTPYSQVTDTVAAAPDAGFSLVCLGFFQLPRGTAGTFDVVIAPSGGGTWNVPATFARHFILEF